MAMIDVGDSGQHAYEIAAEIGKGAYGTVYKARDIKNQGKFVALKVIRILTRTEEGMPMSTIREIGMLRQLEMFEHENVVRLLDVWTGRVNLHEMKLMLVFEHMDQDLAQYLEKSPSCGLGPDNIKDLMQQILKGVDFLHTNRVVHRDLKPQNILLSSQGRIKLADFGLARIYAFSMALTTVVVTLYYRSPEVLLQDSYCSAVDLWSCGTILAELFLRKPFFQGTSEIDQLCKIFQIMGLPAHNEWPPTCSLPRSSFKEAPRQSLQRAIPGIDAHAADLVERLLTFDQRKRISAQMALKHVWFTDEDPDISMSSLSSSNVSHDTSISSLENMESLFVPVSKDNKTDNASSGILLDDLIAREELPSDQQLPGNVANIGPGQIGNGCLGNVDAGSLGAHHGNDEQNGHQRVFVSSSQGMQPCGISILDPVTAGGYLGLSRLTEQTEKSSTSNFTDVPKEPCQPSSTIASHVQHLYKPTATIASHGQPSAIIHNHVHGHYRPLTTVANHVQQPYQPPTTITNHGHYKPLITIANHVQQPFQPQTTINHQYRPVATIAGQVHVQPQPPTSITNEHRIIPTAVSNPVQISCQPSAAASNHILETYKQPTPAILSTNTAVINVPGHPQSHPVIEISGRPVANAYYNAVTSTQSLSGHPACNIPGGSAHHIPHLYTAEDDPSVPKKGIKRSRQF